ncbi:hypothetical protein D0Z00_003163 [Geotrichum galactomycetum]|uniref:Uncharacterized protein n=1 Tax=Geotrichum galactomycetum TaxID=27317 RepID=A0ACB6V236_9ASCO|nr:hypothetical protein D0Z00_003163 [Geotrichum candidum]
MLARFTNRIKMSVTNLTSSLSALTTDSLATEAAAATEVTTPAATAAPDAIALEASEEKKKHPGTAPKTAKRRKSQSQEAFDAQRAEYLARGPVVQTATSLLERDYSGAAAKIDRQALRNAAERAYFIRDYNRALDILRTGLSNTENAGTEAERGGVSVGERERKELETLEKHILKAQAAAAGTAAESS